MTTELSQSSRIYIDDGALLTFLGVSDNFRRAHYCKGFIITIPLHPGLLGRRRPSADLHLSTRPHGQRIYDTSCILLIKFSSISWTDLDGGPWNLVKDGRRSTGYLSGPSTSWTDSDGGPRFFLVSWRRWDSHLVSAHFRGILNNRIREHACLSYS